jgi:hypothetical protein
MADGQLQMARWRARGDSNPGSQAFADQAPKAYATGEGLCVLILARLRARAVLEPLYTSRFLSALDSYFSCLRHLLTIISDRHTSVIPMINETKYKPP